MYRPLFFIERSKGMEVIVETDVPCTLRDGTTLYANVYRPSSRGEVSSIVNKITIQ